MISYKIPSGFSFLAGKIVGFSIKGVIWFDILIGLRV